MRIAPADLDPVEVGQHQVEDDQRRLLGRDLRQRGIAGRDGAHVVARVLQVERDERRDRGLVLDDQNGLSAGSHYGVPFSCRAELEADPRIGEVVAAGAILAAVGTVERVDARLERVALDEAGALADDREVDAAALDQQLEAAADDAEADARAAVANACARDEDLGLVGARDDREVRVAGRRVVDRQRAAVDPAEDAAARLQVDLAAAVLDRERAVAGVQRGERRDRENQGEQGQAEKRLPHGSQYRHGACGGGQVHVRKV